MSEERVFQVFGKNAYYMDKWNAGFMRFMRDNPSARAELLFHEEEPFHNFWASGMLTSIGYRVTWQENDTLAGPFE